MRIYICIAYIMMFVFLVGCNKNGGGNFKEESLKGNLLKINLGKENLNFFDNIDSIEMIELEINNNCVIGNVSKIILYENRYYIYDVLTNSVMCFDINGRYLFHIGKHGNGPIEYNKIKDINLNEEAGYIEMYDRPNKMILCYDLNGNYSKKINIKEYFNSFVSTNDGYLCQVVGDNPEQFNFIIANNKGKIKSKYIPSKGLDKIDIKNQITKDSDQIYFTHGCSYIIYSFEKEEIVPKYFVDFNTSKIPDKYFKKQQIKTSEFFELFDRDYSMVIYSCYNSNNSFVFSYYKSNQTYWALYNKTTMETKTGQFKLFGTPITPPIYKKDGYYYTFIDESFIRNIKEKNIQINNETENKVYNSIIRIIQEKDERKTTNPIILKFKLII